MLEHLAVAHREEQVPSFRFRVVKRCKTALERQVREAVRIEMRGNVLNKKGMFNRCKLTRMVVDTEWEKKVWEAAWEPRAEQEVNTDSLKEPGKAKRNSNERGPAKRLKREEQGVVWGEDAMERDNAKMEFLMEQSIPVVKTGQTSQSAVKFSEGTFMKPVLNSLIYFLIQIYNSEASPQLSRAWVQTF